MQRVHAARPKLLASKLHTCTHDAAARDVCMCIYPLRRSHVCTALQCATRWAKPLPRQGKSRGSNAVRGGIMISEPPTTCVHYRNTCVHGRHTSAHRAGTPDKYSLPPVCIDDGGMNTMKEVGVYYLQFGGGRMVALTPFARSLIGVACILLDNSSEFLHLIFHQSS